MTSIHKQLVVLLAIALSTISCVAHAQVDKTSEKYREDLGTLLGLNNLLNNLSTEKFANDLEMTEEQRELFRNLQMQSVPIIARALSNSTDPIQFEKDWNTAVDWMNSKIELTNQVLLPHQRVQYKILRGIERLGLRRSPVGFSTAKVQELLGLTEEQKSEIKKITDQLKSESEKVAKEVERKKAEMIKKCRRDSLELLTNDQKNEYKEFFGRDFFNSVFERKSNEGDD